MKYFFLLLILFSFSCEFEEVNVSPRFVMIDTPSEYGGEPFLYKSSDEDVYLSWLEYEGDTTFIHQFSKLKDEKWGPVREIARGSNWFVNWADFPSITTYNQDSSLLAAHRLVMSDDGTYDYDIYVSLSSNGGISWDEPFPKLYPETCPK